MSPLAIAVSLQLAAAPAASAAGVKAPPTPPVPAAVVAGHARLISAAPPDVREWIVKAGRHVASTPGSEDQLRPEVVNHFGPRATSEEDLVTVAALVLVEACRNDDGLKSGMKGVADLLQGRGKDAESAARLAREASGGGASGGAGAARVLGVAPMDPERRAKVDQLAAFLWGRLPADADARLRRLEAPVPADALASLTPGRRAALRTALKDAPESLAGAGRCAEDAAQMAAKADAAPDTGGWGGVKSRLASCEADLTAALEGIAHASEEAGLRQARDSARRDLDLLRRQKVQEVAQRVMDETKSASESAKDSLKRALQLMREVIRRQEQNVQAMTQA